MTNNSDSEFVLVALAGVLPSRLFWDAETQTISGGPDIEFEVKLDCQSPVASAYSICEADYVGQVCYAAESQSLTDAHTGQVLTVDPLNSSDHMITDATYDDRPRYIIGEGIQSIAASSGYMSTGTNLRSDELAIVAVGDAVENEGFAPYFLLIDSFIESCLVDALSVRGWRYSLIH